MTFIASLQRACALPYKQKEFLSDYQEIVDVTSRSGVFQLFDMEIDSPQGVYSPHETSSTRFLISHAVSLGLDKPSGEGKLLEVGCGAGAIAIWLARKGWKVCATDLNPVACEATARNATRNAVGPDQLEVVESDLLEQLQGRRFDAIVFNQPLYHVDREIEARELSLTATGTGLHARFMQQAREALNPGGFVVFAFANFSRIEGLDQPGWTLDLRAFEYAASTHSIRSIFRAHKA